MLSLKPIRAHTSIHSTKASPPPRLATGFALINQLFCFGPKAQSPAKQAVLEVGALPLAIAGLQGILEG
jgi:hypothetical protein